MRLDEICTHIIDCVHKTAPISRGGGYFAVGTPAMQDNSINYSEAREISKETYLEWTQRLVPRKGDLLFAREAPVGPVVLIPDSLNVAPGQRTILLRPDSRIVSSKYLYYLISSPSVQSHIMNLSMGSTVTHLNVADVRNLELKIVSLSEQRAIAEVLGALDDKISINRQIHARTGELTGTLFLDVMGGRADMELGEIAEVNKVKVKLGDGSLRYIDIASVSEGEYSSPEPMSWKDAPGRARRGVRRGDTIWSTVRPNRRSHALVLENDPALVCSTGLVTLSPLNEGFSFLYEASRTRVFTEYLLSVAEGSAYPAVVASKFAQAPVPRARKTEIDQFNAQCDPLWERAAAAQAESRTLAALRDTLLPALMSGALRVEDAVKTVEEAV